LTCVLMIWEVDGRSMRDLWRFIWVICGGLERWMVYAKGPTNKMWRLITI
jgi:hypothetical protein